MCELKIIAGFVSVRQLPKFNEKFKFSGLLGWQQTLNEGKSTRIISLHMALLASQEAPPGDISATQILLPL